MMRVHTIGLLENFGDELTAVISVLCRITFVWHYAIHIIVVTNVIKPCVFLLASDKKHALQLSN